VIRTSRSADRIKVTFALPLETAEGQCSVVGDFNEWVPGSHELRKRANGTRSASVTVPRGTRLRFRYLAEDGTWFNDPEVEHREGADDVVVV
jgi:1,4-alpha-glucan branching enzyme